MSAPQAAGPAADTPVTTSTPSGSNLVKRVGFATVAIPLALLVVWVGGWLLAALLAVIAVLGARELFDLASRRDIRPVRGPGLALAGAVPLLTWLALEGRAGMVAWLPYLGAGALLLVQTAVLFTRRAGERPLPAMAVTLFGVAYAAGLPAFLLAIRATYESRSWAGAWLVFFPLVVTWVCDTAAMFGGRAIGGPKLFPSVSPGKTWSGSVAGVAGALVTVPLFDWAFLRPSGVALPLWQGLVFAFVLSIVGQVGDLAESLIKREAGVKDSSALIPGHGGVLDRLDSLYFVLPTAAALYRWILA